MRLLLLATLLLGTLPRAEALETDLSGNIELQGRRSWNNEEAREDLAQDWKQENFYLGYGNINGKVEHNGHILETNWFLRHSQSPLYEPDPFMGFKRPPYFATQIYTFPNRLVARDMFKLQYDRQQDDYRTESVINKLYYQWSSEEYRLTLGRMYVNYGLGEIFNPINPFNQPTGLSSIQQVAQGNDGGAITFFTSEKHSIDFFLLGDKRIEGYDGKIDRTLWVHGEYQATENLQLDYVIGEDQKRQKAGGQINYKFEEAMVFTQVLYQTDYVNNDQSHNLWDVMLGFDQQLTALWHVRGEGGYQKSNRYANATNFGERFLPTEYFIALANQYEAHPLLKLTGTVVNDIKSGFTYLIARSTYSVTDNIEAEIFGMSPVAKGDAADNPAQKLVTTDLGLALRAFF